MGDRKSECKKERAWVGVWGEVTSPLTGGVFDLPQDRFTAFLLAHS